MSKSKNLASISLDLDNQWAYMKTHGDAGWESFPSYFDIFIPNILKILDEFDLKITFFIIGQDAVLDKNKDYLSAIPEHGHEIANHSFNHDTFIQLYSKQQLENEINQAEDAIINATGKKPVGFRAPGFSWGKDLFETLLKLNYEYDASTFPTFLGPLARKFYFASSNFTPEEKEQLKNLYGSVTEGFRPINPYFFKVNSSKIREIPVSTFPVFKTPVHLSYLLYLAKYSEFLMFSYLKSAIVISKITNSEMSFLLHPTDILGSDLIPQLSFFPGMEIKSSKKVEIFKKILTILKSNFNLVTMNEHHKLTKKNTLLPLPASKSN